MIDSFKTIPDKSSESTSSSYTGKLIGLIKIVHPLPSFSMTIVALALSLPLNQSYTIFYFTVFGLAILFANLIVGLSNDLIDIKYDKIVKPHKPLVEGTVSIKEAKILLILYIITFILLIQFFDGILIAFFIIGITCGLAYNAGLKNTPFSFVPYTIAMPTVAIVARLANGNFPTLLFWVYPLGALMSLVLHITNQMNKAEESNKSGEHNLLHYLGVKNGQILIIISIILTLVIFTTIGLFYDLNLLLTLILDVLSIGFIGVFIFIGKKNKRKYFFPLAILLSSLMGIVFINMIVVSA